MQTSSYTNREITQTKYTIAEAQGKQAVPAIWKNSARDWRGDRLMLLRTGKNIVLRMKSRSCEMPEQEGSLEGLGSCTAGGPMGPHRIQLHSK